MMKIIVLTEPKEDMAYCKVTNQIGFATSTVAIGWLEVTEGTKKGDSIELPELAKVEMIEYTDIRSSVTHQYIRIQ